MLPLTVWDQAGQTLYRLSYPGSAFSWKLLGGGGDLPMVLCHSLNAGLVVRIPWDGRDTQTLRYAKRFVWAFCTLRQRGPATWWSKLINQVRIVRKCLIKLDKKQRRKKWKASATMPLGCLWDRSCNVLFVCMGLFTMTESKKTFLRYLSIPQIEIITWYRKLLITFMLMYVLYLATGQENIDETKSNQTLPRNKKAFQ